MKYKNLPEVFQGKVISRNFGHIQHLAGSRMIDAADKLIGAQEQYYFTECKRKPTDIIYVSEKIDGMNAGAVKKNGVIYPISRRGYDVRTLGVIVKELQLLGESWATWVDEHYSILDRILSEGERLVFENAIMTHTLRYAFEDDGVFLLAKYTEDNLKLTRAETQAIADDWGFQMPPLLCSGIAVRPEVVIKQYPKGLVGSLDKIEGIVYNYESDGKHVCCAKFVSNPKLGSSHGSVPSKYNGVKLVRKCGDLVEGSNKLFYNKM